MATKKNAGEIFPPQGVRVVTTGTASGWIDESGIVIFTCLGKQTLENAKDNMNAFRDLAKSRKLPLLLDYANIESLSREARAYYASEESCLAVSAVAIVTGSVIGKLIGNFFIGLNKGTAPVKIFTDLKEAKKWATQFLTTTD